MNRYQLVNWYWLVLVNRWSIDSHIKLSANYIDFHQLAMLYLAIIPFESHKILFHRLLIDFQYQSINCYRMISIGIDFDRLTISSIAYAGQVITVWGPLVWGTVEVDAWRGRPMRAHGAKTWGLRQPPRLLLRAITCNTCHSWAQWMLQVYILLSVYSEIATGVHTQVTADQKLNDED